MEICFRRARCNDQDKTGFIRRRHPQRPPTLPVFVLLKIPSLSSGRDSELHFQDGMFERDVPPSQDTASCKVTAVNYPLTPPSAPSSLETRALVLFPGSFFCLMKTPSLLCTSEERLMA